jgi:hypothetical protein
MPYVNTKNYFCALQNLRDNEKTCVVVYCFHALDFNILSSRFIFF